MSRPSTLVMPIIQSGKELTQIFTDLRQSDTFTWKEAVVIYEERGGARFVSLLVLMVEMVA
jgi:hypothetical protein